MTSSAAAAPFSDNLRISSQHFTNMKLHTLLLTTLASLSFAGTPDKNPIATTPPPADDGWWGRSVLYGWVTAIEGDVAIGPLSAPVDISMSDTLDSLDMGFMGLFEAGRGDWSLGLDVVYGKTSQDIGAGDLLFDSFRYEQKQWLLTPFVAYRAVETEGYHMDVFAGARITVLQADLTGRFAAGGQETRGVDTEWVDPIVGIRGQAALTESVFFRYNADVGGFGVSSDLVWQAFAGIGYKVNDSMSIAVGYRGIGIDYGKDDFTMDTVSHGPVIGLELSF